MKKDTICFVFRIPKELKLEIDKCLLGYKKKTNLRITQTSFLISALKDKLSNFKLKEEKDL